MEKNNKIEPRDYQKNAINKLRDNNWNGIFEMATGTGKTYTSLFAAKEFYLLNNRIFLVILVPFKHLINQWIININQIGFTNIVICSGDNSTWKSDLNTAVRDFQYNINTYQVVISTYNTSSKEDFNKLIKIPSQDGFLIADECHYFGQERMKNTEFDNYMAKLGLSATPKRWLDQIGTERIYNIFKDTVYTYDIKDAIDNKVLVNYKYYPIYTDLTDEEIYKYEIYTKKIVDLLSIEDPTLEELEELKQLTFRRSDIIKTSQLKNKKLINLLKNINIKEACHILVYCGKGQVDNIIHDINKLGFRVSRFDHTIKNSDREIILEAFDRKEIQILVAINCLDEGVDIPATKTAYFLASTSNPRQFIQRRGRILRKHPSKYMAEIYDFITIPSNVKSFTFKSIVQSEIPRIVEFTEYSINKLRSRNDIRERLKCEDIDLSWYIDDIYMNDKELLEFTEE